MIAGMQTSVPPTFRHAGMQEFFIGMGGLMESTAALWEKTVQEFRRAFSFLNGHIGSLAQHAIDLRALEWVATQSADVTLQNAVRQARADYIDLASRAGALAQNAQKINTQINATIASGKQPTAGGGGAGGGGGGVGFVVSVPLLVAGGLVVAAGALATAIYKWATDKAVFDGTMAGLKAGYLDPQTARAALVGSGRGGSLLAGFGQAVGLLVPLLALGVGWAVLRAR